MIRSIMFLINARIFDVRAACPAAIRRLGV